MSGTTNEQNPKAVVKISSKAWLKLKYYVDGADSEVGGLLVINGDRIEDVLLFKQTASYSDFDIDEEELDKEIQKIVANNPELLPKLRGWWHSHVNMSAFFSGTDEKCIARLIEHTKFLVSLVINKSKELNLKVSMNEPFNLEFPARLLIDTQDDEKLKAKCEKELEQKLEPSKVKVYSQQNNFQVSGESKLMKRARRLQKNHPEKWEEFFSEEELQRLEWEDQLGYDISMYRGGFHGHRYDY